MPDVINVREHRPDEVEHLVAVATRAFWDDPLFNFFQPNLLKQLRQLHGFFYSGIGDCSEAGKVFVAELGGKIAGIAAWLPPGVPLPMKGMRMVRSLRRAAPTLMHSPEKVKGLKLLNEMPKHHLHGNHWYLTVLATDPLYQGRGVGTALLEPVLARCDADGVASYLETQKEANLAYYRRFRYDMASVIQVRGAPPVWTMVRQPQVPES